MFFEESLNNEVIATYPYNTNKHPHTFNDQDAYTAEQPNLAVD